MTAPVVGSNSGVEGNLAGKRPSSGSDNNGNIQTGTGNNRDGDTKANGTANVSGTLRRQLGVPASNGAGNGSGSQVGFEGSRGCAFSGSS